MNSNIPHGLVKGLDASSRAAVEQLIELCNRHEGLELPLYLAALPAGAEALQLSYYEQGLLIGFASIAGLLEGWSQVEICGTVHPDYRRRGVGRRLLEELLAVCRERGQQQPLLVCDEAAASGRAFMAAVGAQRQFAEYRMVLDAGAVDRSRPQQDALAIRTAGPEDAELLTRLQAAAFGDAEEVARGHVAYGLQDPTRQYRIATLAGEPIGVMRIGRYTDHVADITAFGVLPAYRGRGYGRQFLLDTVDTLLAERWPLVVIEVETENRNALGLYQSCGFKETTVYGFYGLEQ